ncbi:capsular biosynthesis protein [Rhodobacteraceae bacterium RKSG542]|uniref:capsule biosynthesis protein n=1 Tax=Pseudovibrio flavus TaxID=2529854 RepID=UPI0012BD6DD7|nr:capsular biosynthesis protein [Pseudovibrio flavus]MTI16953.1 capsular biosynthesis protein [Pseudovibrio flavus]
MNAQNERPVEEKRPLKKGRAFLFLQGPPSFFARDMANHCEAWGVRTYRINLCIGDWLFWHDKRATSYRGSLNDWPEFLEGFIADHGITDVVYYQDRFPYHAAALELCRKIGVACYAYEFGYLRPDWITLERDGMGAYSRFPLSADKIRAIAADSPKMDSRPLYPYPFWQEAVGEVVYNLSNFFLFWTYLRFDRDKYYNPLVEYLSILPRLFRSNRKNRAANMLIEDVIESGASYFVFPLQLQSDYQLRYNSQFDHLGEAIELVLESFARSAPKAQRLVFKVHPLDNGIEPWVSLIKKTAKAYGVKRRVHVIDGGNLTTLLKHASGAIMVNSTTGLHALRLMCPVKILGIALYDVEGITFQDGLDAFWNRPSPPDRELLADLEKALAATIQVRGNFYTREGRQVAAISATRMLIENRINSLGALEEVPPRLSRARELGIPTSLLEQIKSRGQKDRILSAWSKQQA